MMYLRTVFETFCKYKISDFLLWAAMCKSDDSGRSFSLWYELTWSKTIGNTFFKTKFSAFTYRINEIKISTLDLFYYVEYDAVLESIQKYKTMLFHSIISVMWNLRQLEKKSVWMYLYLNYSFVANRCYILEEKTNFMLKRRIGRYIGIPIRHILIHDSSQELKYCTKRLDANIIK